MAITPITKKQVRYSDFGRNLAVHPVSSDVSRKTNEESIKESIRNLILTDRGERLFQPNIGCDIRKLFFSNQGPETATLIERLIRETITNHEPRCEIVGIDVGGLIDSNTIDISIVFTLVNHDDEITVNLAMDRIR